MENIKQPYLAPELVDQGAIVNETEATKLGQLWDGSPKDDDDTYEDN